MVSYSAAPTNAQARVRPCTASAATPASSAMRAMASALRAPGSGPVRILSVTGTSTAATTAREDRRDQRLVGQQRRAGGDVADLLRRAAHVDVDDLRAVRDVVARGLGHQRRIGAGDLHRDRRALALVIDAPPRLVGAAQPRDWTRPSPTPRSPRRSRLHSLRNGRSVTPAIGATASLFGKRWGPMRMLGGWLLDGEGLRWMRRRGAIDYTGFAMRCNARATAPRSRRAQRSGAAPRANARSGEAEEHRARERAASRAARRRAARAPAPRGQRRATGGRCAKSCVEAVRERDAGAAVDAPARRDTARACARSPSASRGHALIACASSNASRRPRLKPCPATGCSACAALPTSTRPGRGRRVARIRAPAETPAVAHAREAVDAARRNGARAREERGVGRARACARRPPASSSTRGRSASPSGSSAMGPRGVKRS